MKIIVEEFASETLNFGGKGGAEHQGLPVHLGRHAWDADGAADVGHETLDKLLNIRFKVYASDEQTLQKTPCV